MTRAGLDRVYLDVTPLPPERTMTRFPQIASYCRQYGLDIAKEPIPVAPAAHFMMGGIRTNDWGETNVRNLYACGETACTGVHGANRLASNSLLETMVFAKRIINRTLEANHGPTAPLVEALRLPEAGGYDRNLSAEADATFAESPLSLSNLQSLMWEKAGIVRDGDGLAEAAMTLAMWQRSAVTSLDRPSQELSNLLLVGRLVAEAALIREESRGAHYRTDYPSTLESWRRHIVFRNDA